MGGGWGAPLIGDVILQAFTYDSADYIMHLSFLLNVTASAAEVREIHFFCAGGGVLFFFCIGVAGFFSLDMLRVCDNDGNATTVRTIMTTMTDH